MDCLAGTNTPDYKLFRRLTRSLFAWAGSFTGMLTSPSGALCTESPFLFAYSIAACSYNACESSYPSHTLTQHPYTRIHRLLAKRIAESSDPMRHAHTTHTYITLLSSHASLKSFVTLYICNSGDANTHTRSRFIDSAAPFIARTLVAIALDIYYQHSQYPIQKTSNTSVASLEQPLPHDKTSP